MNELALFSGIGGGILGGKMLGWRTVCAVERELYASRVLLERQRTKNLPSFPIWNNVETFEGKRWCRVVDIVTGGFPCQDISVAGKGAGIKDGTRSGLWGQMARIINEVRPQYAFVENSPAIIRRGLTRVVSDFSEIGYDAKWIILGADDLGFNHKRKRWWCLATNSNSIREQQFQRGEQNQQRWANNQVKNVNTNPNLPKRQRFKQHSMQILRNSNTRISGKVSIQKTRRILQKYRFQNSIKETSELFTRKDIPEPLVRRMVDGNTNRVDILRGLGNAQVPVVAACAFEILYYLTNGYRYEKN